MIVESVVPTIYIEGYKFRFYSSDIYEPPHIHVIQGEKEAKVWLQSVMLEYNRGYNQSEISYILKLTNKNRDKLLEVWNVHFNK